MEELFLPVLHSFENNNIFTGSDGELRFRIVPQVTMIPPKNKEVDFENSSIGCEVWYGQLCYEKSEVADSAVFPMSEEGRQSMRAWLLAHRKDEKPHDAI